jgi:hypothetical protein
MSRIIRSVFLGLVVLTVVVLAHGQGITTGTVLGTVSDPSGAVIPGAQVQLTNQANGLVLTATSNATGDFKFFAVPIGNYQVIVNASSFAVETVNNVLVVAGATTNLNQVKLHIGAVEQVQVNGLASSLLETTDSQVTTTFDTKTITNMPLNNGFDTVTELIPGVVATGDDNFSNSNGDNYSVNGQSGRYNNFEIDGQANNDNTIGGPQVFFGSQDAIQEIQVITNDYSAQYGRNAGAVENYITKSGTNSFHGSAFDLYQDQFLSSMTNGDKNPVFGYCPPGISPTTGCNAPVLPRYVENRAGATIGGPVIRNKLFFFYSTFWDRVRQGASPSQSLPDLTPDPTGIATLESAFAGDPGVAAFADFGPYAVTQGNPTPIPGTATMETITDGSSRSASVEFAGVQRLLPSVYNDQEELARLDWQPTQKDHMFLRFFYQPDLVTNEAGAYASEAAGDFIDNPYTNYSIGADWTHTFTTHLVDQLRYSFQEAKSYFEGGAYPNCVVTNFGACPALVTFLGTNDDTNFGGDTIFPQGRTVKVTQVQNNATWTHGDQTILFGGEFDYQNSPNAGLFDYNGNPFFGTFSNFLGTPDPSIAGYGLPYYTAASPGYADLADGPVVIPFTEPDFAAYLQDDWKVLPTLTLHLGVRWEFFGQAENRLNQETVARETNPATAFWDMSLPLAERTVPTAKQVYTNFEPRIGLAWNPDFDRQLVVSAGYAINANPSYYNMALLVAYGAPVSNSGYFACVDSTACLPASGSLLSSDFRATNLPYLPTGGNPGYDNETTFPTNFRTPYVQTWTLGIDHQVGGAAVVEVRYVGTKTTGDFQSVDANPDMLSVAEAFPSFYSAASLCSDTSAPGYGRPNCNVSNVSEFTNGGWATYNAAEFNLTTRNFYGLTSTWSFTYSKALNNATDGFRSTGAGGSTIAYPQDPLDPSAGESGLSGNDFPYTAGVGFTYDVPKLVESNGVVGRIFNGYMLSGIYRYRSGQVYTPYQPITLDNNTGDTSFCDSAFNSAFLNTDTCRLVLSNKSAPINTVAYLNPYVNSATPYTPVLGTPAYVVYNSDSFDASGNYNPGTPISPSSAHWIINNQAYALLVGNPYPGSGRSLLRGPTFSDLDMTVVKTIPVNERLSLQLSMQVYNVLNQMYLGVGNPFVASSNFTSNAENSSGSVSGDSSGNRFILLGGKVIF